MMGIRSQFADWSERRLEESHRRWRREHRWDVLADYNGRVAKGIVHTPEYVERMRLEQEEWREWVESGGLA